MKATAFPSGYLREGLLFKPASVRFLKALHPPSQRIFHFNKSMLPQSDALSYFWRLKLLLHYLMTDLREFIEHTLLKPDCSLQDVRRICEEASQAGFAGVCIPPFYVRDAKRFLGEGSPVRVATVVGFPMGYTAIAAKSEEIKRAVDDGADEIDAVLHIAAVKSQNWNHVQHDIEGVARATHLRGRISKLILECGLLTEEEIRRVCAIAGEAGIHYLKTGTGFHGFPAIEEMVRLLKALAGDQMKVKASGGIRTREMAEALVRAGADRLGTSSGRTLIGQDE